MLASFGMALRYSFTGLPLIQLESNAALPLKSDYLRLRTRFRLVRHDEAAMLEKLRAAGFANRIARSWLIRAVRSPTS